jgi:hypothetical protein
LITNARYEKIFKILIIITATVGFLLSTFSYESPLKQYAYFTIQSNILVAVVYLTLVIKKDKSSLLLIIKNQATLAIILTGLVYNLMLRPYLDGIDYNPNSLSDLLVHTITPILVLTDFIVFTKNGLMTIFEPLYYLIFPLIYWIFTIVYIALGGNFNFGTEESNYPYFFLNFEKFGIGYFFLVLVFIIIIGYLLFFANKTILKKRGETKNGNI